MARRTATVKITAEGRDQNKLFHLTEMPALKAERWAIRALLALARSGVEIPDEIANAGLAGVAALGMKAFAGLNYDDAEPLLGEMLECVSVISDPSNMNFHRALVDGDLEEVATIAKLRMDVFRLHTNFSTPDANLESTSIAAGKNLPNTRNTRTFHGR
jgi:hypothetical protein